MTAISLWSNISDQEAMRSYFEPLFDKMTAISGEQIVGLALQNQLNDLQADLNNAKSENSKARVI